jgi:capsular polysaccharide biosynthesis protein
MVAIVFIAVTVAVASLVKAPQYEASIKILVGLKGGGSWSWGDSPYEHAQLTQATQTMSEAINTRPVSETVIGQLDLRVTPKEFLEKLRVEQIPETQFVHVSYADPSPQRAQRVANTVGEVVSKRVAKVSPSANTITATVWERAALPDDPVSPNPVRNGLLVLVLGLMLLGLMLIVGLAMSARGDVARGVGDSAHQMTRSVGRTASGTRGGRLPGSPLRRPPRRKSCWRRSGDSGS